MPFCPKCKYEYEDGINVCPDCNLKLVKRLNENKESELVYVDLVIVGRYSYYAQAEEAKILLKSHNIWSVVNNEIVSTMAYPGLITVNISVRKEDEDRARKVLKDEFNG